MGRPVRRRRSSSLRLVDAFQLPIVLFLAAIFIVAEVTLSSGALTTAAARRPPEVPCRPASTPVPPSPSPTVKARAAAAVEAARDEILDLSHRIHANPEPAFEEHQAAAWVADVAGAATASPSSTRRAASTPRSAAGSPGGLGTDGPRIGVLAEYDALPGLGHGCGHNTMAASGVGAAIALAGVARRRSRARSCSSARRRRSAGAASSSCSTTGCSRASTPPCCTTPATATTSTARPLASEDVSVVFHGPPVARVVRAVGGPQRPRRDDRAVRPASGLWRQQLPPHCRVHGIIQEGGTAANIIPDRTRAWFMIRSADQAYYEVMKAPLPRAVRGGGDRRGRARSRSSSRAARAR